MSQRSGTTTPFKIDTPAMSQHGDLQRDGDMYGADLDDSDDNDNLDNQVFMENLVDDMMGRLAVDTGSNKPILPQSINMYS